MADYDFIATMIEDVGFEWNHSWLLGWVEMHAEMFLRNDITREQFTAIYACYNIAKDRFYELLVRYRDCDKALTVLCDELKVATGPASHRSGSKVAPQ
jgi:hypothetical protein